MLHITALALLLTAVSVLDYNIAQTASKLNVGNPCILLNPAKHRFTHYKGQHIMQSKWHYAVRILDTIIFSERNRGFFRHEMREVI